MWWIPREEKSLVPFFLARQKQFFFRERSTKSVKNRVKNHYKEEDDHGMWSILGEEKSLVSFFLAKTKAIFIQRKKHKGCFVWEIKSFNGNNSALIELNFFTNVCLDFKLYCIIILSSSFKENKSFNNCENNMNWKQTYRISLFFQYFYQCSYVVLWDA